MLAGDVGRTPEFCKFCEMSEEKLCISLYTPLIWILLLRKYLEQPIVRIFAHAHNAFSPLPVSAFQEEANNQRTVYPCKKSQLPHRHCLPPLRTSKLSLLIRVIN